MRGLAKKLDSGKIVLTCDELLEIFPEPEECLAKIEAAIDDGLLIVKNEGEKKKHQDFILPEISENEIVAESISWYLNKIGQVSRFTPEEEKKIGVLARQGDQAAREKMINANLRLVVAQAKKFKNRGVSFLDLIQAGNIGLIKAVNKFEPDKKLRFGIFAIPFIKDAIFKAVKKQGFLNKMPREQAEKVRIVQKMRLKLVQDQGRWPTTAEIASATGLEHEEVERILKLDQSLVSLDKEIGEEGRTLIDSLRDEAGIQRLVEIDEELDLEELLEKLTADEQKIIQMLYGLKGTQEKTPQEAADLLGLAVSEVLKIEQEALEKMRAVLGEEKF